MAMVYQQAAALRSMDAYTKSLEHTGVTLQHNSRLDPATQQIQAVKADAVCAGCVEGPLLGRLVAPVVSTMVTKPTHNLFCTY